MKERNIPTPAAVVSHAVHLANCRRKQATECSGQRGAAKEEAVSALGFVAAVPHSN